MSKVSIGILFAAIGLIIVGTYLEFPYFGNGAGFFLVAGLSYAFVVAKREAALMTYVLREDQIVNGDDAGDGPPVPQGMREPARPKVRVGI